MNSTTWITVAGLFVVAISGVLGFQTYQLSQLHARLDALPSVAADASIDEPTTSSEPPATRDPALDSWTDPWSAAFGPDDGWDPFRDLAAMQERMDQLISKSFGRNTEFHPLFDDALVSVHADISESESAIHVSIDLPGMSEEAIDVDLTGNRLSIRGERSEEATESDDQGTYVRRERRFGQVHRSITLPGELDAAGLTSTYDQGVLRITIPKKK